MKKIMGLINAAVVTLAFLGCMALAAYSLGQEKKFEAKQRELTARAWITDHELSYARMKLDDAKRQCQVVALRKGLPPAECDSMARR